MVEDKYASLDRITDIETDWETYDNVQNLRREVLRLRALTGIQPIGRRFTILLDPATADGLRELAERRGHQPDQEAANIVTGAVLNNLLTEKGSSG